MNLSIKDERFADYLQEASGLGDFLNDLLLNQVQPCYQMDTFSSLPTASSHPNLKVKRNKFTNSSDLIKSIQNNYDLLVGTEVFFSLN